MSLSPESSTKINGFVEQHANFMTAQILKSLSSICASTLYSHFADTLHILILTYGDAALLSVQSSLQGLPPSGLTNEDKELVLRLMKR